MVLERGDGGDGRAHGLAPTGLLTGTSRLSPTDRILTSTLGGLLAASLANASAGRAEQLLALAHVDAPVRAPVDRHRDPRAQAGERLGRAAGVEMPGRHAGAPAGDRQQGDVEPGASASMPSKRSVSPAKYTRCEPESMIADGVGLTAVPRCAAARVHGLGGGDLDGAERGRSPAASSVTSCPRLRRSRPPPAAATTRSAPEPLERLHVEVVVVEVRQEHRVERPERRRSAAATRRMHGEPVAQHRVGQEAHAVELDEDRAVADPREAHQCVERGLQRHDHEPESEVEPTATTVPRSRAARRASSGCPARRARPARRRAPARRPSRPSRARGRRAPASPPARTPTARSTTRGGRRRELRASRAGGPCWMLSSRAAA